MSPLDRGRFRVAFGTYDQCIHVFATDNNWGLESVYSVQMRGSRPTSIAFSNTGKTNGRGDILVFGRDDGVMWVNTTSYNADWLTPSSYTLDGTNGKVIHTATMNPPVWCEIHI